MKNRKISKTYVIAAVALSVTLLIAGCGPGTEQAQAGYDSTKEEIQIMDSENKNMELMKMQQQKKHLKL